MYNLCVSLVLSSFFCISLYTCANDICINLLLTYLFTYYFKKSKDTHSLISDDLFFAICYLKLRILFSRRRFSSYTLAWKCWKCYTYIDNFRHIHGRSQAWARGGTCPSPSVNVVKCFVHSSYSWKRSVDELFMHYFHNLSPASGGFAPRTPPGLHYWTPLGDFCLQPPNLPTPGKNPAGAHGHNEL